MSSSGSDAGERSTIKFVVAFIPPGEMSRAASLEHYRERHGPLVASVPEFRRHVRAYVQNEVIDVPAVVATERVDGVSELWYDDWASYHRAFTEPRYLEIIRPDEYRFADLENVLIVFAEDDAIFGGEGTPPFKFIRFLTRAEGVSIEEFRRAWRDHAAAIRDDELIRTRATAYIQNRAVPNSENPFPLSRLFDGTDEFWFDRLEDIPDLLARERDIARRTGMDRATAPGSAIEMVTRARPIPGFGPAEA